MCKGVKPDTMFKFVILFLTSLLPACRTEFTFNKRDVFSPFDPKDTPSTFTKQELDDIKLLKPSLMLPPSNSIPTTPLNSPEKITPISFAKPHSNSFVKFPPIPSASIEKIPHKIPQKIPSIRFPSSKPSIATVPSKYIVVTPKPIQDVQGIVNAEYEGKKKFLKGKSGAGETFTNLYYYYYPDSKDSQERESGYKHPDSLSESSYSDHSGGRYPGDYSGERSPDDYGTVGNGGIYNVGLHIKYLVKIVIPLFIIGAILLALSSLSFSINRNIYGRSVDSSSHSLIVNQIEDKVEKLFGNFLTVLDSDECLKRAICEVGSASGDLSATPYFIRLVDPYIPLEMKGSMALFKATALGKKKKNCKRYKCKTVNRPGTSPTDSETSTLQAV